MTNKFIYILIPFLFLSFLSKAQQERKHIRQGNRDYEKATIDSVTTDTVKYQDAEVDYRKALDKDPNNWDASYNLANALYKQAKYEDATKQFQAVSALESGDKLKTAMAYHNLGNSFLQASKLEEAIEAYKNSLRQNPKDLETKYNLSWAQNKLKEQQQENQDQNKDQDKKDQDKKDQEQENKDQQKQDQEQDQNKEEQQQNQQQKQDQQQQDQQQQQPKDQISKEDAMRILEALQNDEKEVQDKVQKQKAKPKKRNTEKDW